MKKLFLIIFGIGILGSGITVVVTILAFSVILVEAFVWMKLWNWLIVPVFAVSPFSYLMSFVVAFLADYVFTVFGDGNYRKFKSKDGKIVLDADAGTAIVEKVIKLAFFLLFGWLIHITVF